MAVDLDPGLEQHRQGDLEGAAKVYEAALAEDPDRSEALHLLGLVHFQRNELEQAATLITRAATLAPEQAPYHVSLAEVYWAQGKLDDAVLSCQTALQIQPDNPDILCNLGATFVDQGRIDEALSCFHQALQLNPNLAAAHNNLGNVLQIQGDSKSALAHFHMAVRLDPSVAGAHNNLGKALLERGKWSEALTHCQSAVQLSPEFPEAHINLGNVHFVLGDLESAAASFREALRFKPSMAGALASLGGVQEQLGEIEQAIASFHEALRHEPKHAGALAKLATLLGGKLPEADQKQIESLLASTSLTSDQRIRLQFGLAHVLEAQGKYDQAADLALQANDLQEGELQRRDRGYHPTTFHRFVDQIVHAFTSEFFAKVKDWRLPSERPVFVIGMPRSGTSLIEHILASHSRVFGAGELRLAQATFEVIPQITGSCEALSDCLGRLEQPGIETLAQHYLDGLANVNSTADRVVDKMPENTVYLGLIASLFAHAKVIYCRRDVRDVALSCWMTNFGQVRWACDFDHIASRIAEHQRLMDHWRTVLPLPILEIDYEEVVSDAEAASRKIVAWCGLEWEPACGEFHRTRRPVRTASAAQVREPVYDRSVGRWRRYEQRLAELFSKLEVR